MGSTFGNPAALVNSSTDMSTLQRSPLDGQRFSLTAPAQVLFYMSIEKSKEASCHDPVDEA
jgi:hypothetical protein